MKTIFYCLIVFFVSINSYSQPALIWHKHLRATPPNYQNWQHKQITVDGNGNSYVIGQSGGPSGMYVLSYDQFGAMRFCDTTLIGTMGLYGQAFDPQCNAYLFASEGPSGSILRKYSSQGSFLWESSVSWNSDWSRVIASDQYVNVLFSRDNPRTIYRFTASGALTDSVDVPYQNSFCFGILAGDYIICGKIYGSSPQLVVNRVTLTGTQVWSRSFNPLGATDVPAGTYVASSGNIYYFVHSGSPSAGYDYTVAKLSSDGTLLWAVPYSGAGSGFISSWVIDNAENIYVSNVNCTAKFNSSGVFQWSNPNTQGVLSLDSSNNVIGSAFSDTTIRTWKLSPAGSNLWSVSYHVPYNSPNNFLSGVACDKYYIYVAAIYDSGSITSVVLKYGEVFSVSGQVRFKDNSQPVNSGYVKAVMYDSATKQVRIIDSASIQSNGMYTLPYIPKVIVTDIMAFENDESQLYFVPTYYPSTIYHDSATALTVNSNLTNIDIAVYRINNTGGPYHIAGTVNYSYDLPLSGLRSAIVYAKLGNNFQAYSITNGTGNYRVDSLTSGTYDLIVDRMGFSTLYRQVTISNYSKDTIDFTLTTGPSGIQTLSGNVPISPWLGNNYPNPFNPETRISFGIPVNSKVRIVVYDLLGREVAILADEQLKAGSYSVGWNASSFASGVYFYRIETNIFTATKKMVLVK